MTDRIDRYLDGAVERATLTSDERDQADALERAIEETRAFVESSPPPDLTAAVMRRIERFPVRPYARAS